jgi:Ca2+-binding RTX toxin-like protein
MRYCRRTAGGKTGSLRRRDFRDSLSRSFAEPLERRRLLAAAATTAAPLTITNSKTASLANRVLTITGSAGSDVFNIHPSIVNGQPVVRAFGTNYKTKDFDYIRLNLLDGNDYAEIFNAAISVVGGNGNDTIFTHQSSDPTYAQQKLNVMGFDGGGGTDLYRTDAGGILDLRKSPTVENVYFSAQGRTGTLYGNALANNLEIFNVFRFTAQGLGGNDTIHAATAGGTIDAGDGNDTITLDYYGNFTLKGGNGNDYILNRSDACLMQGGAGNDTLIGGLEGDTLDGGTGADRMDGGDDDIDFVNYHLDVIDYSSRTHAVSVKQDGIANDGEAGEGDNVIGMSIIRGGSANDVLDGRDHETAQIFGNGGNDKILGPPHDEMFSSENFGAKLFGGTGNDTLQGGDGDDRLDGGSGADVLQGGGGFDTVDYSARKANLTVSIGNNLADDGEAGEHDNIGASIGKVIGGSGNDLLRGDSAANVLLGLAGNDTLFGGGGNDALFGGSGNDQLHGEAGNDYLEGQSGADKLDGGAGTDTALADGADTLISIESRK